MIKILFYLMTDKGVSVLEELVANKKNDHILGVVSSYDANVRDNSFYRIKDLCQINNIEFFDRKEFAIKDTTKSGDYLSLAIGWRWMIPYTDNLIVLHDSFLPKYRGFAPTVNSLINGEKYLGVSMLYASSDYDCGDIIFQKKIEISYPIKIKDAIKVQSSMYSELVIKLIQYLEIGKNLPRKKQDDSLASYSVWRDDDDYLIDWSLNANKIKRIVDAVGFPYKGAQTYINGLLHTIDEVEVIHDVVIENRDFGKQLFSIDGDPVVICGSGMLRLNSILDSSGKRIKLKKFRNRFLK